MVCRNNLALTLVAGAAVLFSLPVAGEDPPQYGWRLDGSAFLRYGEGIQTPHTKWCNPCALGTVKALFIANKSAAYDVPELGRRMDVEIHGMPADTWLRLGTNYWLSLWLESSSSSERSGILESVLDDEHRYDVIVLGNYRFLSLPESIQYKILNKVATGCGLVMFYPHDVDPRLLSRPLPDVPERLAAGIPFAGLDYYRDLFMPKRDLLTADQIGAELFRAYQFGEGRVLEVDYATQSSVFDAVPGSITPFEENDSTAPVRYDYHQSMAARCILWAAGKEPRFKWTQPFPDGMEVAALSESVSVPIEAIWTGSGRTPLTRHTRVRNRWGEVLHEKVEPFRANRGRFGWKIALPPLPGGTHFVDVLVSSKKGIENWASFSVEVSPPVRIDAIEMSDTFFDRGEHVRGRIILSRAPRKGEKVKLSLFLEDGYGRIFSRMRIPVRPGEDRISFRMPQGNLVSWGARLWAKVLLDDRLIHQDEVELRFWRPSRGEYPIAMWGAADGFANHIGNLQMRGLGFTTVLEGDPLPQARDDLGWMTFGAGRGAQIHSLGDEIPIPRVKQGKVFAGFLRERYTTIERLNASWGAEYADWEDAEPSARVIDGSPENFVRFHDSLSCGEFMFAEMCRTRREAIEKVNPHGVVGPEGSRVGNPDLTLPQVTFWGPYLTIRDNLLVNGVAAPGILRGNWFGGYVEDRQVETRLRHVLWLSILGGNNMIEYFSIMDGLLAPDLSLMPFTDEFLDSWHQIRRGIGPLLAKCRPAGNPVALLHSQASQHIGQAGGQWTDTVQAHEYMLQLLGDAGYSPQYVTTSQVEAGRLHKGDIKVLMLLHAFALSDHVIAEIKAFAEHGGTVIADISPAWFDDDCRLRPVRAMDAFFGIEPRSATASLAGRLRRMQNLDRVRSDGNSLLLRGRDLSLPEGEEILVRDHGGGRSVYLGGVIWKESRDDSDTIAAVRELIEEAAETPRAFRTRYAIPLGRTGTMVYSYRRGDIRIDAVLPPEATDRDIPVVPVIEWDETKHTYDLRREAYLGELSRLEQEVERSSPLVVARLDYRVGEVRLETPGGARRGLVLPLTCSVIDSEGSARPGHVVWVEVYDPMGNECPYYGAWLDQEGRRHSWRIPFALDDAPGEWRIVATDVISGVSGETTVVLREATDSTGSSNLPAK